MIQFISLAPWQVDTNGLFREQSIERPSQSKLCLQIIVNQHCKYILKHKPSECESLYEYQQIDGICMSAVVIIGIDNPRREGLPYGCSAKARSRFIKSMWRVFTLAMAGVWKQRKRICKCVIDFLWPSCVVLIVHSDGTAHNQDWLHV